MGMVGIVTEGYQLIYPECIRDLISGSDNQPMAAAALSWIVLRLKYVNFPALAGIAFEVVCVDYPGTHLTIGAKYEDPTIDLEPIIIEAIEHILNKTSAKQFFDFVIQNDSWQREADRLMK